MDSTRKTALVAGVLYLITFVSIPTLGLHRAVQDPNYVLGPGADTGVAFGGPGAAWEFSLGVWLVIKGFKAPTPAHP